MTRLISRRAINLTAFLTINFVIIFLLTSLLIYVKQLNFLKHSFDNQDKLKILFFKLTEFNIP